MEHGSGLAASLQVGHILVVGGRENSRFGAFSLWTECPLRRIDSRPPGDDHPTDETAAPTAGISGSCRDYQH